jgi:aminoglycoside 6-adenylyltransferase
MRSEEEVLSLLLGYAESDPRVKVVLLNGSRVNPNVPKDILCDYDVIFGVTEPSSFVQNQDWITKWEF